MGTEGLRVKCPNCKRVYFLTTEKFNPDITPNGSMVKPLVKYQIDWLCSRVTSVAEMTCPECLAQLAPKGRLHVIPREEAPVPPTVLGIPGGEEETAISDVAEAEVSTGGAFVCEKCGRSFKSAKALAGHAKVHTFRT